MKLTLNYLNWVFNYHFNQITLQFTTLFYKGIEVTTASFDSDLGFLRNNYYLKE